MFTLSVHLCGWTVSIIFYYRERADNGLFVTLVPKVNDVSFSLSYNFGDFIEFWLVSIELSVQTFQTLILTNRRGNFVYYHWGCTSIFRSLPYLFRSLILL